MTIFKNMSEFSAIPGGDNDAAFTAFNTWAIGQTDQIDLTWDAGVYNTPSNVPLAHGVKDLVCHGGGAARITMGGSQLFLAGKFLPGAETDETHTSYIETVSAGSSSLQLRTTSEYTRYATGDWLLILGVDTQKSGWPPNAAVFEYVEIGSVASDGVIHLATALKYGYKSTWPFYVQKNQGGPATIIRCDPSWNASVDWRGFQFGTSGTSKTFYSPARLAKFTDCEFLADEGGFNPTQSQTTILTNVTQSGLMELDKINENVTFSGGSFGQIIVASSSGANLMTVENGATIDNLNGTPKKLVASDSTITTFHVGSGFGPTKSLELSNCEIGTWVLGGSVISNVEIDYSMSGGIITVPKAAQLYGAPWAVPDTNCMFARFSGGVISEGAPFRVTDLTDDATNVYVHTNLSGGFPTLPTDATNGLTIWDHPCPSFIGTGLTGSRTSDDLKQSGAQNRPLGEYTKRTYDTAALLPVGVAAGKCLCFGALVSIKINVTKAYTGVRSTLKMFAVLPEFGSNAVNSSGAEIGYTPVIDLRQTGLRTVLPGSVSGLQGVDSISAPGSIWFESVFTPILSDDISGESSSVWPSVDIEVITDHGIVSVAEVLRLIYRKI